MKNSNYKNKTTEVDNLCKIHTYQIITVKTKTVNNKNKKV